MSLEVFFNRPGKPWPIKRLFYDIARAKNHILVASAFLTDREFLAELAAANARATIVVGVREMTPEEEQREWDTGIAAEGALLFVPDRRVRGGMMHHKFVVIDQRIVWFGSFNFTRGARTNYENIARCTSRAVVAQFADEFSHIFGDEVDRRDGVAA